MGKRSSEMNLDALVKKGYPPWAPASGVGEIEPWHEYDIPTAGTFALDGHPVLFTLIGEPNDRLTVWAYTEFPAGKDPGMFESTQDLDAAINDLFVGHKAVFAIADGLKIWQWTPIEVDGSIVLAATEFLRGIRRALEDKGDNPSTNFRAELASVEVQTTDLVDA
jgi:hypothetical protein